MRKRSLSILALVIAGILTFYFLGMIYGTQVVHQGMNETSGGTVLDHPDDDTAFGGLFAQTHINDSLPHYLYQHLKDSAQHLIDERMAENRGTWTTGMYTGPWGVFTMQDRRKSSDTFYYFILTGYKLDPDAKFFMQNGQHNLAYPVWDSTTNNGRWRHGHYARKQIPVRYTEGDQLLIPVTRRQHDLLNALINLMTFIELFAALYFFLGLPIQILVNISKGRAFDDSNIRRFNIIGWGVLAWAVKSMLSPYVLWFFCRKVIPDDFIKPPVRPLIEANVVLIFGAIAAFITGKAFQKGNKLQKEQDLTI